MKWHEAGNLFVKAGSFLESIGNGHHSLFGKMLRYNGDSLINKNLENLNMNWNLHVSDVLQKGQLQIHTLRYLVPGFY